MQGGGGCAAVAARRREQGLEIGIREQPLAGLVLESIVRDWVVILCSACDGVTCYKTWCAVSVDILPFPGNINRKGKNI